MQDKLADKMRIETQLFATCINYPEKIDKILSHINPDNLEKENYLIYDFLLNAGDVTYETLIEEIKGKGLDIQRYALAEIISDNSLDSKLKQYFDVKISIFTEKLFEKLLRKSKEQKLGLDLIIEAQEKLRDFESEVDSFRAVKSLSERYDEIVDKIKSEKANPNISTINSTAYPTFNEMTKGIKAGNLVTICGAFKHGKSSFGIQLMMDFALNSGHNVAIFSLEMSQDEIDRKIIGTRLGIEANKLRYAKSLSDEDLEMLKKGKEKFRKGKIYVYQKSIASEIEIKAKTKQFIRDYKVEIILVDYIGLIEPTRKAKTDNRERELAYISKYLKNMAQEFQIPIISVAQLNRQGLKNPSSSNLAESIAIARDSDFILIVYKPSSIGYKEIEITQRGQEKKFQVNDSHFIVTLSDSRHTKSGDNMVLQMDEFGELREIDLFYDF